MDMQYKAPKKVIDRMLKRLIISVICIAALVIAFLAYAFSVKNQVSKKYIKANEAFQRATYESYEEAITLWSELGDYKDSLERIEETEQIIAKIDATQKAYEEADRLLSAGDYRQAAVLFQSLNEPERANEALYTYAEELYSSDYSGHLSDALAVYQELGDYKDSELKAATISVALYNDNQQIIYKEAERLFDSGEYDGAIEELNKIPDYEKTASLLQACESAILHAMRLKLAESVSVGIEYTVAITNSGHVVTTAENMPWQHEIEDWNDIISVSCMEVAIVALKSDGTVVVSTSASNINVDDWQDKDIIAVSAGDLYIVGLQRNGLVSKSGHNGDGQCNLDDKIWNNIVAIATGWRHTVGLRKTEDGKSEILIAGYGKNIQEKQVKAEAERWEDVIAIAAGGGNSDYRGDGHTVGLKADGTVVVVGDNEYGQRNTNGWKDVVQVAAGDWFTAGLTSSGKILITHPSDEIINGTNLYTGVFQAEKWTDIVYIAAGCGNIIGIDKNGVIHAAGNNDNQQRDNALKWEDILVYPK